MGQGVLNLRREQPNIGSVSVVASAVRPRARPAYSMRRKRLGGVPRPRDETSFGRSMPPGLSPFDRRPGRPPTNECHSSKFPSCFAASL